MISKLKNPKETRSIQFTVQMLGKDKKVFNLPIEKGKSETYLTDRTAALKLLAIYIETNPGKKFRLVSTAVNSVAYDWMTNKKLLNLKLKK